MQHTRALRMRAWSLLFLLVCSLVAATFNALPVLAAQVTIDTSVQNQASRHDGSAPASVFVSDQVGYVFYGEAATANTCVYKKTTNGGSTWGSPVTVSPTNCRHVTVWYDRWTPGDDTGNYIYIITANSTAEDLMYNRLDTSTDTLQLGSSPVAISSSPGPAKTNTFENHDNYPAISKSTNGTVYAGVHDSDTSGQSYVLRCAASCNTASNWSDTSAGLKESTNVEAKNFGMVLEPLSSGDMMLIVSDTDLDDILSKVFDEGTDTWDGSWTTVDTDAAFNATYAGLGLGAAVDKRTGDIYIAYTGDGIPFNDGNDDVRTAIYSGGSWTAKTDVVTNYASAGIITPQLSFDENTGSVYVAYLSGVSGSANINWKKSTDGMTSWGTEQGTVNTTASVLYGMRITPQSNERVHLMWTDGTATTSGTRILYGDTIADLTPPTYTQSAFRLFNNNNSTNVGTTLALQDTAASLASTGDAFRLRMLMHVAGDGVRANVEDFKLQFVDKGAGTCAAPSGGTPASYTDVTTSTAISFNNNATPADGASLTSNANDPTHSGHTIRNQTYEEANNFSNTVAAIANNEDGKWDFSLYDNGATGSTSYCFRIVQSDGTALSTYSQYPQITTASGNTAPDSPASLAQVKTDNSTISTGSWTNETSVKFTATATDTDSSDTLQLCVEKKPLGQSFTNSEDSCGTGVAYSGVGVSVSVTIASQTDDEYHWQARIKDAAATYSSWVSYGGNAESARDYGVDSTTPTSGTVYDGTSVGVDAAFNNNSLSSLSANWSSFNTNISGLARYDYSIGTTAGGTDVKGWTNNGTTTSVTATGLTLQTSKPYYINVRAVDNAGNVQSGVSSDGQLVLPSLSFGISASSVSFANLNATNSYTDTKTTTLTTSTNAYGGYAVRAFALDFLRAGALATIPDFSGGTYASPDTWQSGDTGFGYTSSDTLVQGVNKFQASTCPGGTALASPGCYAPFSQTAPGDIVADHTANVSGTPITDEEFTITYRVTTSSSQAAAPSYATTIVYSVTPIY